MAKGIKYKHRAIRAVLLDQLGGSNLTDKEKRDLLSLLGSVNDSAPQNGTLATFFDDFGVDGLWESYDVHDEIQPGSVDAPLDDDNKKQARAELKEFVSILDGISEAVLKAKLQSVFSAQTDTQGKVVKLKPIPEKKEEVNKQTAKAFFAARLIELGKSEKELKGYGFTEQDITSGCEQYTKWLNEEKANAWLADFLRTIKLPKESFDGLFTKLFPAANAGEDAATAAASSRKSNLSHAHKNNFYLPNDVADLLDLGVTNEEFDGAKYTPEEIAAGLKAYLNRELTSEKVGKLVKDQGFDLAAIHQALPANLGKTHEGLSAEEQKERDKDEEKTRTIIKLLKQADKSVQDFVEAGYSRAELSAVVNTDGTPQTIFGDEDIAPGIVKYINPEQESVQSQVPAEEAVEPAQASDDDEVVPESVDAQQPEGGQGNASTQYDAVGIEDDLALGLEGAQGQSQAQEQQKAKIEKLKKLHKQGFTTIKDVQALITKKTDTAEDAAPVDASKITDLIRAGYSKDELKNALVAKYPSPQADESSRPTSVESASGDQSVSAQGAETASPQVSQTQLTANEHADQDLKKALEGLINKCLASSGNEFEELGQNLKRQGFEDATIKSVLQDLVGKHNTSETSSQSVTSVKGGGEAKKSGDKSSQVASLIRAGFAYHVLNDESLFGKKNGWGFGKKSSFDQGLSQLLTQSVGIQSISFDRTKLDQSDEFGKVFQESLNKFLTGYVDSNSKEKGMRSADVSIIAKLIACRCKKTELLKAGVTDDSTLLKALTEFMVMENALDRIDRVALAIQGFTDQEIQRALFKVNFKVTAPEAGAQEAVNAGTQNNGDAVQSFPSESASQGASAEGDQKTDLKKVAALIKGGFTYEELTAKKEDGEPVITKETLGKALSQITEEYENNAPALREFIIKLHENGYPAELLKSAGYTVAQLQGIYTDAELRAGGFKEEELQGASHRFDYNTTQSNIAPLVSAALEDNGAADVANVHKFAEAFYGEKLWRGMTRSDVPILDVQELNKMSPFMLGLDLKVLADFLKGQKGQDDKPLTESSSSLYAILWDATSDKDNPHGKFRSALAQKIPGQWKGFLKELFENADENIKNKLTFAQLVTLSYVKKEGDSFAGSLEVMRKTQQHMSDKLQASIANQLTKLQAQDPKNPSKPSLEEIQKLQRAQLAVVELESIRARQNFQNIADDLAQKLSKGTAAASKLNNVILLLQNAQRQFVNKCRAVTAKDGGVEKIKKLKGSSKAGSGESSKDLFVQIVGEDGPAGLDATQKEQLKSAFIAMMSQTEQMQIVLYEQGIFREVDSGPDAENKDNQQGVTDEEDSDVGITITPLGRNIQESHFKIQKALVEESFQGGIITYNSATKTLTMKRVESSKVHFLKVEEQRKQYAKAVIEAAIGEGWGSSGITITVHNHKDHIKQAKYIIDEATRCGIKVTIAAASDVPPAYRQKIEDEYSELNQHVKMRQKVMEERAKTELEKGEVNKEFGEFSEKVQEIMKKQPNDTGVQEEFDKLWDGAQRKEKVELIRSLIMQVNSPNNQLAAKIASMIVIASLQYKEDTGLQFNTDFRNLKNSAGEHIGGKLYRALCEKYPEVLQKHVEEVGGRKITGSETSLQGILQAPDFKGANLLALNEKTTETNSRSREPSRRMGY